MDLNLAVFQEPRGVMRIFHLVFSICAFATISGYAGYIMYSCGNENQRYDFDYPFNLNWNAKLNNCTPAIHADFSSDAKFFVATGVLAMLYSLAIIAVYAKFDEMYRTNVKWPLYDFVLTVIFGVLWLSSSAAWANSVAGLKRVTDSSDCKDCTITVKSFSTLNISVIFGFLNFFLWAADLWFLFKETTWFKGNQPESTSGV